ncbi:MAG: hypothetical protein IAI50_16235 [Candidatus Eremiobacteraeota bacterium]|nr:hypothetical protein [Candidatus Eremiobacteraeota bacterium]
MLIPLVTEVTVGSVSLKLTKIGAQLLDETSKVLQDWTAVLNVYVADAHLTTDGKWPQRLEQFVLWRLSEAFEWAGTPEDAPLQLCVWLANSGTRQLEFTYGLGFEANPTEKIGFEEGVIGASFTEHISRNEIEPDAFPVMGAYSPQSTVLRSFMLHRNSIEKSH